MSEKFLIIAIIQRDINVHTSSCKVALILFRYEWNQNVLDIFSKNTQISNFIIIRPAGTELFNANGQTDMAKLVLAIRNFAKASKMDDATVVGSRTEGEQGGKV